MIVTVTSIGVFASLPKSVCVDLPEGARFSDLINAVSPEYPEFREILCSDAVKGVAILRNGRSILLEGGDRASLASGDDIFIAPMTFGG